jgi:ATP-dependent Zn protease
VAIGADWSPVDVLKRVVPAGPGAAGHATVAYFFARDESRLEVLTIIKRRDSLGLLLHGDLEERFTRTRSEMETRIAIALGGMVSEEVFLGESGTGPSSDLRTATALAAQMVGALGMAGSLVSYEAMLEGPLNTKNLTGKVLSDADGKRRVEEILNAQKERVTTLLENNRDIVAALRDALVERDELVGDEITDVIHAAIAARPDASPIGNGETAGARLLVSGEISASEAD